MQKNETIQNIFISIKCGIEIFEINVKIGQMFAQIWSNWLTNRSLSLKLLVRIWACRISFDAERCDDEKNIPPD